MAKRSRRTWLLVVLAGLVALAAVAHLTGSRITTTLREMHSRP